MVFNGSSLSPKEQERWAPSELMGCWMEYSTGTKKRERALLCRSWSKWKVSGLVFLLLPYLMLEYTKAFLNRCCQDLLLVRRKKKQKHLGCFDPKSSASNSQPHALYIGKAVAVFAVSVLKKVKASGLFPFKKLTNKQTITNCYFLFCTPSITSYLKLQYF